MYVDCYKLCGVSNSQCKNHYCEANPRYAPPPIKEKPKGGAGKPSTKLRSKIKKEDGKYPLFFK